jgi:histidinol-phosphatase
VCARTDIATPRTTVARTTIAVDDWSPVRAGGEFMASFPPERYAAPAMNDDLAFALSLADTADVITLPRFRAADLAVRTKPDRTPVTEADQAAERALRDRIAAERPTEAVIGEEEGASGSDVARARWIIDPIDGTNNYLRGIPVWATLLALERDGRLAVAVVSAPALGRRWWAARGAGAFANGDRIHVSPVDDLARAQLCYASFTSWEAAGRGERFLDLLRRCGRTRGFGDFWAHMLVAEGAAEVAVEPEVALWDLAAVHLIVEEAGGRFTDLQGQSRADGGSAVSSNGRVHDEVLTLLGG